MSDGMWSVFFRWMESTSAVVEGALQINLDGLSRKRFDLNGLPDDLESALPQAISNSHHLDFEVMSVVLHNVAAMCVRVQLEASEEAWRRGNHGHVEWQVAGRTRASIASVHRHIAIATFSLFGVHVLAIAARRGRCCFGTWRCSKRMHGMYTRVCW